MLILVDGRKSVQELSRFSSDAQQATQVLSELFDAGLVAVAEPALELPSTVAPAPTGANPTPFASPAGESPRDLKLVIRKATQMLEGLLGPTCEPLCLQLEKCSNFDEFSAKVQHFRRVVASVRSEKKADKFITEALR